MWHCSISQLQGSGAAALLCNCARFPIFPVSASGENQKTTGAKELFGEAKGRRNILVENSQYLGRDLILILFLNFNFILNLVFLILILFLF